MKRRRIEKKREKGYAMDYRLVIGAALIAAVFTLLGGSVVYLFLTDQCDWTQGISSQVEKTWSTLTRVGQR